jgi:pimeloyl-ACP methyl ester carboxylesterase
MRCRVGAVLLVLVCMGWTGAAMAVQTQPPDPGSGDPVSVDSVSRPWGLHPCATARERCEGTLQVPLDWDDPNSELTTIAFVWLPRGDTTRPATGTLLINPGGPAAAIPWVERYRDVLGPVLERKNLLVVDPRGLGASDPLECDGLDTAEAETVTACVGKLGPRIRHYSTAHVIRDMDAVRDALGVEKVLLYGNSYGTVFAQAYAIRYPQRTAAIYLDSVVPVDEAGWVAPADFAPIQHSELICGRSSACSSNPGGARAVIGSLVERLRVEPDPAVPIGRLPFLLNGANMVGSREVVAAAAAYLEGDPLPLHRLSGEVGGIAIPTFPVEAGALAIQCADAQFPFERAASPEDRRRQLERFYEREKVFAPFRRSELISGMTWAEECLYWPSSGDHPPAPRESTHPTMPVLAVAGDFDVASPEEVAAAVSQFPSSTLIRVRFGGHAMAMGTRSYGECVRSYVRAFLQRPEIPPTPTPTDSGDLVGCDGETYRAVGSFPRTVGDMPPARGEDLSRPERQLLAAAFATAADAMARRNPDERLLRRAEAKGLRGGNTRWIADTRTIQLEEVRFVEDLAVSGTIQIGSEEAATVEFVMTGNDGTARSLTLHFRAFRPVDEVHVTGQLDGRSLVASVPLH